MGRPSKAQSTGEAPEQCKVLPQSRLGYKEGSTGSGCVKKVYGPGSGTEKGVPSGLKASEPDGNAGPGEHQGLSNGTL